MTEEQLRSILRGHFLADHQVESLIDDLLPRFEEARKERDALERWVTDLQSGMYVNCVYCGHRYGPESEIPASMAEALKEHVEQCPKHPMYALKRELEQVKHEMKQWEQKNEQGA